MANKTKKTIALFTTGEGHLSISQAIEQLLNEEYDVKIFYTNDILLQLYTPIYQNLAGFWKVPYELTKQNTFVEFAKYSNNFRYRKKVVDFLDQTQPDLCISTYFMYNRTLENECQQRGIPFINVVPDPRSFHPILIAEQATINTVFDQKAIDVWQNVFPTARLQELGWFVRKDFTPVSNKQAIRKNLKMIPGALTFLIVSGSEGSNLILKILPGLLATKKPLQIVVACGGNKILLRSVKLLSKILRKTDREHRVIPLAFTTKLHKYMQASDLIIGKAGPNTLFETIATHTPFFAITHMGGQEDGNLELIKEYGLGYVEENPFKALKLLKKIISQPKVLKKFDPGIQELAFKNTQTKPDFKKLVARLLS